MDEKKSSFFVKVSHYCTPVSKFKNLQIEVTFFLSFLIVFYGGTRRSFERQIFKTIAVKK